MERILIVMRHGARDGIDLTLDNELNEKGKAQANALGEYFAKRFSGAAVKLASGPKIRCIQTILPTCNKFDEDLPEIDNRLDEQNKGSEELAAFKKRVEDYLNWWYSSDDIGEVLLASSHGDWVPLALEILDASNEDVSKAGWIEIIKGESGPIFSKSKKQIEL